MYGFSRTLTVDDSGGKQYKTIQAAVNAAKSGDTIYVYAGSYPETVTVNRPDMLLYFQEKRQVPATNTRKLTDFLSGVRQEVISTDSILLKTVSATTL